MKVQNNVFISAGMDNKKFFLTPDFIPTSENSEIQLTQEDIFKILNISSVNEIEFYTAATSVITIEGASISYSPVIICANLIALQTEGVVLYCKYQLTSNIDFDVILNENGTVNGLLTFSSNA